MDPRHPCALRERILSDARDTSFAEACGTTIRIVPPTEETYDRNRAFWQRIISQIRDHHLRVSGITYQPATGSDPYERRSERRISHIRVARDTLFIRPYRKAEFDIDFGDIIELTIS